NNLQELQLLFDYGNEKFIGFENLQYIKFSQLQILKIRCEYPKCEFLIKFLENNGKNLREIYVGDLNGCSDNLLNLAIAKFCTNLRKLSTGFKSNELETLKIVFNSCQYLESIMIWCGGEFLSEKEALEEFVNHSKNIYELILYHPFDVKSVL